MEKIPSAKEFLASHEILGEYSGEMDCEVYTKYEVRKLLVEFAKLHVEAALKEAFESIPYGGSDLITHDDVKGILTCYPLENIK